MPLRSFRLVCAESDVPLVEQLLEAEGYRFEPEPFSPICRRLLAEPAPLGSSLAAFFGLIYIQDRSSMLPPLALAPRPGATVLDMCASPGSKTGFLAHIVGNAGFVLANEPNAARLATLRANMQRANLLQVGTCAYAGEKIPLPENSLDYILLDPPCSGWGTAEKNPAVLRLWQGKNLDRLTAIQKSLLRQAARLLKPGGRLLYSTCTTNRDENQLQTIFAERELGLAREPLQPFAGFTFEDSGEGCLLVAGEASQAQGFYLSLLRKPGIAAENARGRPDGLSQLPDAAWPRDICDPSLLPPGIACNFNGRARFLPDGAWCVVRPGFAWQGSLLGQMREAAGQAALVPQPWQRGTIPHAAPRLTLAEPARIRDLLCGRNVSTDIRAARAALCWRDLPLGIVDIKNGRAISRFGLCKA